jgi:hypothetical protein
MPSRVPSLTFAVLLAVIPTAQAGQTAPAASATRRQAAPPPAAEQVRPAPVPMVPPAADSGQTRDQLREVLSQYPPSVSDVLRIDPSLLASDAYLTNYPALASFLAAHPEVAHNPSYFVGTENQRGWRDDSPQAEAMRMWNNLIDGLQVFTVMVTVALSLGWLIRTLLDYRRWLRISKVQTEIHTKLVDRFASNEDLANYIQTPAGRKFLESAPIPLDAQTPRAVSAPINRILWSVQLGVVVACGGFGMLFISRRQMPEIAQPLFALGSLAVAIGAGFVVSAAISYLLSKRLGLVSGPTGPSPASGPPDVSM